MALNLPEKKLEIDEASFLQALEALKDETVQVWKDSTLELFLASIPGTGIKTYGRNEEEAFNKLIQKYVLYREALKFD